MTQWKCIETWLLGESTTTLHCRFSCAFCSGPNELTKYLQNQFLKTFQCINYEEINDLHLRRTEMSRGSLEWKVSYITCDVNSTFLLKKLTRLINYTLNTTRKHLLWSTGLCPIKRHNQGDSSTVGSSVSELDKTRLHYMSYEFQGWKINPGSWGDLNWTTEQYQDSVVFNEEE